MSQQGQFPPSPLDTLSPEERSERMGRIKGRDTKLELLVRGLLSRRGYRYRLQYAKLPGKPDIAFPGKRKIIWVHGCFWHRHEGCRLARLPKTRQDFWVPKLEGNKERDEANQDAVRILGWDALVLWECQLRDTASLEWQLMQFLGATK